MYSHDLICIIFLCITSSVRSPTVDEMAEYLTVNISYCFNFYQAGADRDTRHDCYPCNIEKHWRDTWVSPVFNSQTGKIKFLMIINWNNISRELKKNWSSFVSEQRRIYIICEQTEHKEVIRSDGGLQQLRAIGLCPESLMWWGWENKSTFVKFLSVSNTVNALCLMLQVTAVINQNLRGWVPNVTMRRLSFLIMLKNIKKDVIWMTLMCPSPFYG